MVLQALAWVGGKSAYANQKTGPWVASMLPSDSRMCYVEPFAGMLGVLLQRPKSTNELVNDTNDRVVNWWRCLRDEPEELLRRVELTPWARSEFEHAVEHVDDQSLSPVVRAAHFTTVVRQSIRSSDQNHSTSWRRHLGKGQHSPTVGVVKKLELVAERIRDVQIENVDAVVLLDRLSCYENVVIYCDPPYPTANQYLSLYERGVDFGALADVLRGQAGRVAISGYGSEWDHLGWRRYEHSAHRVTPGVPGPGAERVEVLWTNYPPVGQAAMF